MQYVSRSHHALGMPGAERLRDSVPLHAILETQMGQVHRTTYIKTTARFTSTYFSPITIIFNFQLKLTIHPHLQDAPVAAMCAAPPVIEWKMNITD